MLFRKYLLITIKAGLGLRVQEKKKICNCVSYFRTYFWLYMLQYDFFRPPQCDFKCQICDFVSYNCYLTHKQNLYLLTVILFYSVTFKFTVAMFIFSPHNCNFVTQSQWDAIWIYIATMWLTSQLWVSPNCDFITHNVTLHAKIWLYISIMWL